MSPPTFSLSGEFARSPLGHGARTKRLIEIGMALERAPAASFPAMFCDLASTKRAYEFLGNPAVLPVNVLRGHVLNTLDRCASRRRVLLVMDMTELDYTDHRATRGLGPIGDGNGRGVHVLTVLALDANTLEPLGVLHQECWVRTAVQPGRRRSESTYARSLRERESQYWQRAIRASRNAIGEAAPTTRFVVVADQGADIFDNFETCRACNFGFVIGMYQDRRLDVPDADSDSSVGVASHLMARLAQQPVVAHKEVNVRDTNNRAMRVARCEVRHTTVSIHAPQTRRGHSSQKLTVVQLRETQAPAGEKPVCWNLATDETITNAVDALQQATEYESRWTVEDFHMGLKTGCAIEQRQFKSRHAIENFLSMASAQTWQMLWLRQQARAATPSTVATILSPGQREALHVLCSHLPRDANAKESLAAIAKLGGYFGRKSDGPPGWRTIWKGFQYLMTYAEGFEAARDHSEILLPPRLK